MNRNVRSFQKFVNEYGYLYNFYIAFPDLASGRIPPFIIISSGH